jgi:hypothetical protein
MVGGDCAYIRRRTLGSRTRQRSAGHSRNGGEIPRWNTGLDLTLSNIITATRSSNRLDNRNQNWGTPLIPDFDAYPLTTSSKTTSFFLSYWPASKPMVSFDVMKCSTDVFNLEIKGRILSSCHTISGRTGTTILFLFD